MTVGVVIITQTPRFAEAWSTNYIQLHYQNLSDILGSTWGWGFRGLGLMVDHGDSDHHDHHEHHGHHHQHRPDADSQGKPEDLAVLLLV